MGLYEEFMFDSPAVDDFRSLRFAQTPASHAHPVFIHNRLD